MVAPKWRQRGRFTKRMRPGGRIAAVLSRLRARSDFDFAMGPSEKKKPRGGRGSSNRPESSSKVLADEAPVKDDVARAASTIQLGCRQLSDLDRALRGRSVFKQKRGR
jgi:hypothetical protein